MDKHPGKQTEWRIPFGKHKGTPLSKLPTSYLEFLTEQDWFLEKFGQAAKLIGKEMELRYHLKVAADLKKQRGQKGETDGDQ